MLNAAPLESARFGLRTYRSSLSNPDADSLLEEMIANRVDLAILRTPTRIPNALQVLETRGLQVFHADTLANYECRLDRNVPEPLRNRDLNIVEAGKEDSAEILKLIRSVFDQYPNHYRANPLLAPDDIVAGYGEWALSFLNERNRIAWLVKIDNRVAAIACSSYEAGGICHGVLHGVHPDFTGSGIYTDLIRHTQHYFRDRGYSILSISTQIGNLPAQRVWAREGFFLAEVYDTTHINALLDTGRPGSLHRSLPAKAFPENEALSQQALISHFIEFASAIIDSPGKSALVTSTPEDCHASFWSVPDPIDKCEVRVRFYRTFPEGCLAMASLHDAAGRICGTARIRSGSFPDVHGI